MGYYFFAITLPKKIGELFGPRIRAGNTNEEFV